MKETSAKKTTAKKATTKGKKVQSVGGDVQVLEPVAIPNFVIPELIFEGHTETLSNGNVIIHHPIYSVNNPIIFQKLLGNREVKKAHTETMYASILRHGVLRDIVVVYIKATGMYALADGQHLTRAMMLYGATFYKFVLIAVETEVEAFELVAILNITQKRFSLADLIQGWSNYKDEYKDILAFRDAYNISDRVLVCLLTGLSSASAVAAVQRGEFKILNREQAEKKILAVYDFKSKTDFDNLGAYGVAGLLQLFDKVGFDEYNANKRRFTKRALELLEERKLLHVPFGKTADAFKFYKEAWLTM